VNRSIIQCILLLSCLSSSSAHAIWEWINDSAVSEFNDADWEILKSTARETLSNTPDGDQVNWKNEASGNRGAMKPLMTFSYDGHTCRRMAFLNVNHKGIRGVLNYNLCQQPDATWMFISDSEVTAAEK